ncbi:type II secretion system protein N [Thalassotalea ponticola]|uniref:type II secretion system protein N n=1 Tax=Thalassotalea ponticola TaxID=1523392 RepID=UPI0025B33367|nr:type II secretion system protein N [Thalassotalea ponticola]MDN3653005.1 type II secretion system protein N [Thalassotalea ponticola]
MSVVKKYILPIFAFLLLYVLFVVVLAPAKKVLSYVDLPKGVYLGMVSGSVFSGKADVVRLGDHSVEQVQWQLKPLSLLLLNPTADVTFGAPRLGYQGQLTASNLLATPSLRNVEITADADYVVGQLNLMVDVQAQGQLQLALENFIPGQAVCEQATGDLLWQQAEINATGEYVALGDFDADISCQQGDVVLDVNKDNGLGIELKASFNGRQVRANGFLTPGEQFPQALEPMLGFMGRKDNQGRYRIRI